MAHPRILFVAMAHSVHATRWINLVRESGQWDTALYPCLYMPRHSTLSADVPIFYPSLSGSRFSSQTIAHWPRRVIDLIRCRLRGIPGGSQHQPVAPLVRLIREWKPDIVHALELQHGGYLALQALERFPLTERPKFGITNWGSDLFLYRKRLDHKPWITRLLAAADFYSAECARDVTMVKEMGFNCHTWPVVPGSAGLHMELVNTINANAEPPSRRRIIMIKGYQHFAGRALTSLAALKHCVEEIRPYTLCVFSPSKSVRRAFMQFAEANKLELIFLKGIPHADMLGWYARARCYLGTGISDGISTSVLEAMAMGAFPIQSNTACCQEWFTHGATGFAPSPDDVSAIANAIKRTLTDDALVDAAAPVNRATIAARADRQHLQQIILAEYARAVA